MHAASVFKTIAYFDFFQFPVTIEEIRRAMPIRVDDTEVLQEVLSLLERTGEIVCKDGYYRLAGRPESIVELRKESHRRAQFLIRKAQRIARWIRVIPFVRGVFMTGSLSKSVALEDDDIDFLIVVEPDRVWLSRTLFTLIKKVLLLNQNDSFCVNLILSEDGLKIRQENIYTAYETATVRALSDQKLLNRFRAENRWIETYLPNWEYSEAADESRPRTIWVQRILEWPFRLLPPTFCENGLIRVWRWIWRKRHPDLSRDKIEKLFQCLRNVSSRWNIDYHEDIVASVDHRSKEVLKKIA